MTDTQRDATIGMVQAVLAVHHCPPDIRFRAENLLAKLTIGADNPFAGTRLGDIFAGMRR